MFLKNGKKVELNNVIYAKDLSRNLLSLRKFVEKGLNIYLDNKCINIYNPKTRKVVLSGLYKSPFWEIELTVNKQENETKSTESRNNRIFVNIATRSGKDTEKASENKKEISKMQNETNNDLLCTINNRNIICGDKTTHSEIKQSIEPEIENFEN